MTAQIKQRIAAKPIPDRLVSMFDPNARPIRKGQGRLANEFGYLLQHCEITPNTRRGAGGFILPAATRSGNPPASEMFPNTASELRRLGLCAGEVALDGGFEQRPIAEAPHELSSERLSSPGASNRVHEGPATLLRKCLARARPPP